MSVIDTGKSFPFFTSPKSNSFFVLVKVLYYFYKQHEQVLILKFLFHTNSLLRNARLADF